MKTEKTRLHKTLLLLVVAFTVVFSSGFRNQASADVGLCPGNPYSGFSIAIVYCTEAVIDDALYGTNGSKLLPHSTGLMPLVVKLLSPALWAAITLAIALYGIKLVTLSVEEVVKESALLIFRIAIALYLEQLLGGPGLGAPSLYNLFVDVMNALMTWTSGAFNLPGRYTEINPTLGCVVPAGLPSSYTVWAYFDCVFYDMLNIHGFGAEVGIAVGIIAMAFAAFVSAPIGVAILLAVITLYVMILLTLARALYTVLLSFFVLALLVVIGPIITPAMVFDNSFTKEVFWKWIGMICSTIFAPMFLVGFLSFFVLVVNEFVDGTNLPCNFKAPGAGAVCSFYQIVNQNCNAWKAPASNTTTPTNICLTGGPLFSLAFNVKWKPKCGCSLGDLFLGCVPFFSSFACDDLLPLISTVVSWGEDILNSLVNLFTKVILNVMQELINTIIQFFISLMAFLITVYILRELMEKIPDLAREMTMSVGLGVLKLAQMPLEKAVLDGVKGAGDAMKGAAGGAQGLSKSELNPGSGGKQGFADSFKSSMPGIMKSGAGGFLGGLRRNLISKQ